MNKENSFNSSWFELNRAQFEHADGLAHEIGEQNTAYGELIESGAVTNESIRQATTDYLGDIQQQTFGSLVEAGEAAPYAELGQRDLQIEAAIGSVAARLAAIEGQQSEEIEAIRRDQELVARQLPDFAPKLSELVEQLQKRPVDEEKESLEIEKIDLMAERAAMAVAYEAVGQAWPIPRLPKRGGVDKPEVVFVDNFPEKGRALTKEEVVARVRHNYPEEILRGASEFIALLLAEEPRYVYSLEELADILYGNKDGMYRARVSALLSSFERGKVKIIGEVLHRNELVFQRGQRSSYRKDTGERFGYSHPVFRAVSASDLDRKERIVHSDSDVEWVHDGWHTITYSTDEPEVLQPRDTEVTEIRVERLTEQEPPKSLQSVPPVTQTAPVRVKQERASRKEPAWVTDFRTDLQEIISRFETDGLMLEGELKWQLVRIKSSSRSMATETMAERAVSNGIISRSESILDGSLAVTKYICMALQNNHQALFTNRPQRERVVKIVEETVGRYFEKKKKSAEGK